MRPKPSFYPTQPCFGWNRPGRFSAIFPAIGGVRRPYASRRRISRPGAIHPTGEATPCLSATRLATPQCRVSLGGKSDGDSVGGDRRRRRAAAISAAAPVSGGRLGLAVGGVGGAGGCGLGGAGAGVGRWAGQARRRPGAGRDATARPARGSAGRGYRSPRRRTPARSARSSLDAGAGES